MNKKLFFLFAFIIFSFTLHAQLLVNTEAATGNEEVKESTENLLAVFTDAIKPTSYLSTFKKDEFFRGLEKSNGVKDLAKNISILAGFIKPDKFKNNITASGLMKTSDGLTTMSQATDLLKNLEAALKPQATSDIWRLQRNGWLATLKDMK